MDQTTHSLEAIPLHSTAAADIADAFIHALASLPSLHQIGGFNSPLWAAAMKKMAIRHQVSTAFHPQSNVKGVAAGPVKKALR
jgi:hypothetical protein